MHSITRRDFVRLGAAVAGTCASAGRLNAAPLRLPIGLQLYSVRELLPKDFDGTLRKVREAGYTEVEAAGYYDRTAADFRKAMDKAGLRCTSTHHTLALLLAHQDELIEYGRALGLDFMICPWPMRRDPALSGALTLDDWRWVAAAGRNPVDYLSKTPERFPLLHVKDMARGAMGKFHSTVMGRGVVDYRAILRAATGLKHYFIEQEEFDMDTMEALRLDAEYMRKLEL